MLKGLTSTFKNGCNNVEVMYREYLVLENQTIPIKAELSDDSYENGNFIGTFIFKTIKFETDAQYDFKNKEFEYYKEVNGESIKIGTFITTDVEINDTTEIIKVVGMDYGLKTQVEYTSTLNYASGNVTLLDVWNECCTLSGLTSGIDYFPNGDFIVDNDQFTGTGATIRDVFKGIAMSSGSFVKVMNDDKIYLVFNSYTGDTETTTINGSGSIDDGYAVEELQIEGKAEQHSYSGKNYVNTNKDPDWKYGNTVWERSGSNVTVKNNGTSTYAFVEYYVDNLKPNTTYTFSFDAVANDNGIINATISYPRATGGVTNIRSLNTAGKTAHLTGQFTTPSDTSGICIIFYSVRGTYHANAETTYSNIQIEEGSSETSYEPYTGNLPTPNPYYPEEVKTVSGIGNLLDRDNCEEDKIGVWSSGGSVTNTNSLFSQYIEVKANKKYSFEYGASVFFYSEDKTYLGCLQSNGTTIAKTSGGTFTNITIPNINEIYYMRLSFRYGSSTPDYTLTDIMVNEGEILHQYVPYGHWLPVKVSNKNLFSGDYSQFDSIGGEGTIYGYFKLPKANTRYTLTVIAKKDFTPTNYTYIGFTGNGGNATAGNRWAVAGNMQTFAKGSTRTIDNLYNGRILEYVSLFKNDAQTLETFTEYFDIQVEEGTTATEYIEHQEQTTLIDLNKYDENNNIVGNYEICTTLTAPANNLDVLTIKDGRAVLTKRMGKYVVNENTLFGSATQQVGLFWILNAFTFVSYRGISNFFVNNPDTRITANAQAFQYLSDGQFAFRWNNTTPSNRDRVYFKYLDLGSDTNAFKNWAIENKLTLYYRQTAEDITLRGTYDINLYEGVNYISIEDELEPTMVMSYYNDNLDIIEDYVELEDKRDTQPWTCLRLGVSQIDGENIDYIDEDLVAKYGENWLILNDNPFAYNQLKRQELITAIFTNIKTFGYSAFVSKTSFKPYLTTGDIVQFKNRNGDLVRTILLRYTHKAEDLELSAPSETSATVNYIYPLSAVQMAKNIQIEVDKDKEQISSIVEQVGIVQETASSNADNINSLTSLVNGQGEQIDVLGTRITQNVNEITASVSAIQEEISEGVGLVKTTSVTIDDNGLSVSTDTSKIQTTMTNDTFKITDSGNTELAKFGYDESQGISVAEMDNLTVKNYFIAGVHRVETIEIDGEERTGWFYMGG